MNKTMYEINRMYRNGKFTGCIVTPITILKETPIEGTGLISIEAKDANGQKFLGSLDNYYASATEAWAAFRRELVDDIQSIEQEISTLQGQLVNVKGFLDDVDAMNVRGE